MLREGRRKRYETAGFSVYDVYFLLLRPGTFVFEYCGSGQVRFEYYSSGDGGIEDQRVSVSGTDPDASHLERGRRDGAPDALQLGEHLW